MNARINARIEGMRSFKEAISGETTATKATVTAIARHPRARRAVFRRRSPVRCPARRGRPSQQAGRPRINPTLRRSPGHSQPGVLRRHAADVLMRLELML